jgi:hypothetical protein
MSGCTLGYRASTEPQGIQPSELACARRVYVGEQPHRGMPHVPGDVHTIERVKASLKRQAPEIELVDRPSDAEFVVSVMVGSAGECPNCVPQTDSQWFAVVERGGPTHQMEYSSVAPFLSLSGNVREGASAVRGLARQLVGLIRQGDCAV